MGKIFSIAVVSLASLIVLTACAVAAVVFLRARIGRERNFPPAAGERAVSPAGNAIVISRSNGDSSFLYRRSPGNEATVRLTSATRGTESEPSFSHDGKHLVYSFSEDPESKSQIWIVGLDGSNPHALTSKSEDAMHAVFAPDDAKVYYGASRFTGNHSPVVRPARHDWDVFSITLSPGTMTANASPVEITHSHLYDLRSVDVVADVVIPGATKVLISTSAYPIGPLLEEFVLGATGRDKIFQPHVQDEPSTGPAYGEARFLHGGMDILFLAASEGSGGFDYNVYSMSDVTGSDLKELTHLNGATTDLQLFPDGNIAFVNGGVTQLVRIGMQMATPTSPVERSRTPHRR